MHETKLTGKDDSIVDVVQRLISLLGKDAFDVVDHWEDDLCAIGLGSPSDHGMLVDISTIGLSTGRYNIHLELPSTHQSDFPYIDAGQHTSVNFTQLCEIVKKHLVL